ncbi:MAG TPA: phosphatidylserine decarboxylase family protein [Thermoanaerobaculia bacterium]|nr:phosphatidylserine decarboxylase family protein [Thermoanaerobaculia bacterium]
METPEGTKLVKARPGGWLSRDYAHIDRWIRRLKKYVADHPRDLVAPIAEFRDMVHSDRVLHAQVEAMFAEAYEHKEFTPLGQIEVRTFEQFLQLLNAIMTTAPEAYQDIPTHQPSGLIGFPINALLDWPMATESGYDVFANALVNQQFKKILAYWSQFLCTKESRYVLTERASKLDPETLVVPWLGDLAKAEMVQVAKAAVGEGPNPTPDRFEEIFNCDPKAEYYGFGSWDNFFTRTFRSGVRPVSGKGDDSVIVNACESAPLQVKTEVSLDARLWLKGQPYSLENMLNFDEHTPLFAGGTVYQAFLSALSFHRWHSPVSGTIRKAYMVNGSYYLENLYEGFKNPQGADPSAPNDSQPFLTAVATRALIFIEADNPKIGLMCVMPVGMAEVSSCEITVEAGKRVEKGDQLGMFHFGGSTHCLLFRPGVNLKFNFYGQTPNLDATNMRLNTAIATVL